MGIQFALAANMGHYENSQVKFGEFREKKRLTSYRYDLLPLLHSCPGGVKRELVMSAGCKCNNTIFISNI
tara:strand:+ start:7959 stop:8168 length:210 start_codon:yes stop_codon:yes gene_type:complete